MSKEQSSKLDPHAERLDQWFGKEKRTLAWVQKQLAADGLSISLDALSKWWQGRSQQILQAQLLNQITTGAQACKEVKKQFGKDAAPELETLIKLHQVLILKLSTMGNVNPDFLAQADSMMRTVMEFVSSRTKAAQEEQKIKLRERAEERQAGKLKLEREKFELEASAKLLDKALRARADEINSSSLSQVDKIAAMRKAAFHDVDALQQSGAVKLPG